MLLFEICIAKQRLAHVRKDSRQEESVAMLLKQLMNLYDEVYKRTVVSAGVSEELLDWYLLFTEASPDGVIVTNDTYQESLLVMTKKDLATHVLVPLKLDQVG